MGSLGLDIPVSTLVALGHLLEVRVGFQSIIGRGEAYIATLVLTSVVLKHRHVECHLYLPEPVVHTSFEGKWPFQF